MLLLGSEVTEHKEKNHVLKSNVLLKELRWPSVLFTPLDNNKTFAVSLKKMFFISYSSKL